MVNKISKLTNAQKAEIPGWAEKWRKIGLSTEPADRPRAEAAYRACYRAAGLRDDVPIVWVESPLVGALAASLRARFNVKPQVFNIEIENAVRNEIYSAVNTALHAQAWRVGLHLSEYRAPSVRT